MKFNTDKIEWTSSMKDFAESIIEKKLDRIIENPNNGDIKLTKLNDNAIKVTLCIDGLRAQSISDDFYAAIVDVTSKIKSIASRAKAKKANHHQISMQELGLTPEISDISDFISKEKVFNLNAVTLNTAIEEFEKTDYPFYVFKNIDNNNNIAIIYKRYNNTYGLIHCN